MRCALKLARRHAHEISKHGCEVRLVLEAHSQRDIHELCVAVAEKLLGSIDAFL
jgi:hypothetical protein